jgi:hypothetical protein
MGLKIRKLSKVRLLLVLLGLLVSLETSLAEAAAKLQSYDTIDEVIVRFGSPISDKTVTCKNNDPVLKEFQCRHVSFVVGGKNTTVIFKKMMRYRLKNGKFRYVNPEFNYRSNFYNDQEYYWVAIGTLRK